MERQLPKDLEQVILHLGANERITGILAIGSLVDNVLTPASDYDLVIVLEDLTPLWYVGVTTIGGRFTDLLFVSSDALRQIQELESAPANAHELAPIIRWLKRGAMLLDRTGQLDSTQRHVRQSKLLGPVSDAGAHGAWFATNYNLAVVDRLVQSPDPYYLSVADIRMAVYGHSDLWFNYFAIRRMEWDGDKAAWRYLCEHDPDYLGCYCDFVAATARAVKLDGYRRTAAHATAPLGGLWTVPTAETNVLSPPVTWADLVGDPQQSSKESYSVR